MKSAMTIPPRALFVTMALVAMSLLPRPVGAQEGGFDSAALAAYARAQGGSESPRLYAYVGTVYDVPSGRILATVDGFQIARAFPAARNEPDTWYLVRRAFLLYRAPGSGAVLAYYPDVRAKTTPLPSLSIARFQLRGDRIVTTAVSGVRANTRNISLPEQTGALREDDGWVFQRVLSPPDPLQKPLELTETLLSERADGAGPRIRSVMTKVADNWGFLPPGGRHLLHLSWRPVASMASLAPRVRSLLDDEAPAVKSLPESLAAAFAELGVTGVAPPLTTAP